MAAVDTNVLVRLVTFDDPKQSAKVEALEGQLWVSHVVLQETVWVLIKRYGFDRAAVCKMVAMITCHDRLVVEEPLVVRAAADCFEVSKVEFSDCLALEIARARGKLPFKTFDKELAKLDGAEKP